MSHVVHKDIFTYYESDEQVLGLIIGDLRGAEADVERIVMFPEAKRGDMVKMIKAGLAELKMRGVERVAFVIPALDSRLGALARRFGFTCYFFDENHAHYYRKV